MAKVTLLVNGLVKTVKDGADANAVIEQLKEKGCKVERIKPQPTMKTLEKYSNDGIARATDGCKVEPDGECIHGHKSWLLQLGFI